MVTSFLFQAHPVHTVCAGPMLWDLDQAADIMKWYREFIVQAPEEINGFFAFLTVPPGPPFPEALALQEDVRASSGATTDRWSRRTRSWSRCAASGRRRSSSSRRCRFRCCRACSTAFIRPGCSGTGRRISSRSSSDEAIALHIKHGVAAADAALHDAPVPDQRRGAQGGKRRHAVELSRCHLERGDRRRRPGSGQQGSHYRLGARTTGKRCIRTGPAARTSTS